MKIIIYGTGKIANKFYEYAKQNVEIVAIMDSDQQKWGNTWKQWEILKPEKQLLQELDYDKIIIAISNWRAVKNSIVQKYGIERNKIDNIYFLKREELLKINDGQSQLTVEQQQYIEYIRENGLDVFNGDFVTKYDQLDVEVFKDESTGLFYIYYRGKQMYFSRAYQSAGQVANYIRNILREQDEQSPHFYNVRDLKMDKNMVALDAGVAEGNFALEIIDQVGKIYLVEADELWCEALRYTFAPYAEKVEIVNAFLGDGMEDSVSIDDIVVDCKLDILKMDIEGGEVRALYGASACLQNNHMQLRICTYHNHEDYDTIKNLLCQANYICKSSEGYMVFLTVDNLKDQEIPQQVKGVLYAEK